MKHTLPPVLAFALLVLVLPASLRAQACQGRDSFENARYRMEANAARYTYASAAGVSLSAGKRFFGTLSAGRAHDPELYATTYDLGLRGGFEHVVGPERRFFVCPGVALLLSTGPRAFLLRPTSFRRVDAALGVDVGVLALRSSALSVVPTVGLSAHRVRATMIHHHEDPPDWSYSDNYGMVRLGLGFVVGERLGVRPGVSIPFNLSDPADYFWHVAPFGREEQEIGLEVSVAFSLGRRGSAAR